MHGGSAAENAPLLRAVLDGASGPYRDITILNAAAVFYVAEHAPDMETGVALAAESIDSGAARDALRRMIAVSQGSSPALVG